jgi:hypothetical protein
MILKDTVLTLSFSEVSLLHTTSSGLACHQKHIESYTHRRNSTLDYLVLTLYSANKPFSRSTAEDITSVASLRRDRLLETNSMYIESLYALLKQTHNIIRHPLPFSTLRFHNPLCIGIPPLFFFSRLPTRPLNILTLSNF